MGAMGLMQRLLGRRGAPDLPPPSYSNDAVIARIEREEGVDRDTARAWFREMLIFLDLCARSDRLLSPPPDVDKAWHAFLLNTRDYETYCLERFGRVIHHQPSGEPDPGAYRRAYRMRRGYSGVTPDPLLWTVPAGGADGDDDDRDEHGGGNAVSGGFGGHGGSTWDAGGSGDSGGGGDSGGSSCGGGGCGGGS